MVLWFNDLYVTEGPIQSLLSVCPSVCPPIVQHFSSGTTRSFFLIFDIIVGNWNIEKLAELSFPRKLIIGQI